MEYGTGLSEVRTRAHNIVMNVPNLRDKAMYLGDNPSSFERVFELLVLEDMLQEILHWTSKNNGTSKKYRNRYFGFCSGH